MSSDTTAERPRRPSRTRRSRSHAIWFAVALVAAIIGPANPSRFQPARPKLSGPRHVV